MTPAAAAVGVATAYDVPAVAKMTEQLQKEARRPGNKDDQLKQLMARGAEKYLDAREWGDKTYRHYAVSLAPRGTARSLAGGRGGRADTWAAAASRRIRRPISCCRICRRVWATCVRWCWT